MNVLRQNGFPEMWKENWIFDDVPDALMYDGSIAIEYESPAVHMQESGAVLGLYKTIETALSMAQTNPEILKMFDMENALRQIADYYGVSSKIVLTAEETMSKIAQE